MKLQEQQFVVYRFFSNSGGLSTVNAYLNFKAASAPVVASFTLSNGSALSSQQDELFLF